MDSEIKLKCECGGTVRFKIGYSCEKCSKWFTIEEIIKYLEDIEQKVKKIGRKRNKPKRQQNV